jgi:hypothetical protein
VWGYACCQQWLQLREGEEEGQMVQQLLMTVAESRREGAGTVMLILLEGLTLLIAETCTPTQLPVGGGELGLRLLSRWEAKVEVGPQLVRSVESTFPR